MKNQKKKSFPRRVFLCLLAVLLAVYVAFGIYVSDYYHADLTDSGLRVYAAYGSEDGVLNRENTKPTARTSHRTPPKLSLTAAVMPGSAATVRRRAMAHPPSLPRNNSGRRRTRWRHG